MLATAPTEPAFPCGCGSAAIMHTILGRRPPLPPDKCKVRVHYGQYVCLSLEAIPQLYLHKKMAPIMNNITAYTGLLALLTTTATARHAHRRSSHIHARQLVVPDIAVDGDTPSSTTQPLPAITAGNAAIEDIHDLQSGLSDLPRNLLAFIQAVDQRLGEVEGVLQSLVSSSSQAAPPAPEEPASSAIGWSTFLPPSPTPVSTATSIPSPILSATPPLPSTDLLQPISTIAPPAPYTPASTPSSFATTWTSRMTSTRTRTSTSTIHIPIATGTGAPYMPINGTAITSSASATGARAVYPINLPLKQTFVTTLRAAATPPRVV